MCATIMNISAGWAPATIIRENEVTYACPDGETTIEQTLDACGTCLVGSDRFSPDHTDACARFPNTTWHQYESAINPFAYISISSGSVRGCAGDPWPAMCACEGTQVIYGERAKYNGASDIADLSIVKARPNGEKAESWAYYHNSRQWLYTPPVGSAIEGLYFNPHKLYEFVDDGNGWDATMPRCASNSTPVAPCWIEKHNLESISSDQRVPTTLKDAAGRYRQVRFNTPSTTTGSVSGATAHHTIHVEPEVFSSLKEDIEIDFSSVSTSGPYAQARASAGYSIAYKWVFGHQTYEFSDHPDSGAANKIVFGHSNPAVNAVNVTYSWQTTMTRLDGSNAGTDVSIQWTPLTLKDGCTADMLTTVSSCALGNHMTFWWPAGDTTRFMWDPDTTLSVEVLQAPAAFPGGGGGNGDGGENNGPIPSTDVEDTGLPAATIAAIVGAVVGVLGLVVCAVISKKFLCAPAGKAPQGGGITMTKMTTSSTGEGV